MAEGKFSVLILAAGKATRFKSEHSKMLHRLAGRPLGEYALRAAMGVHPAETWMVIGHEASEVRKAFERPGLAFIEQKEQKGTGHAVMAARDELARSSSPTVLILVGDVPLLAPETLGGLAAAHAHSRAAATVLTTQVENSAGYGRIVRKGGRVTGIVEEKVATVAERRIREINSGILCFDRKKLLAHLNSLSADNAQKEFLLTDLVEILIHHREKVAAYAVADSRQVLGVNDRWELAGMEKILRLRKAEALAQSGVTIVNPEATYIDGDAEVGPDTVIEPGVSLLGQTRVGRDCVLRPYSTITDSTLGDRVTVRPCCVISGCAIASNVILGPFAHLRDGAVIEDNARIGNFVEVKKSRVGRGTKAWHLTYLGDATLGSNVNIGAGTVTCNYDGEKKNPTTIEEGAFIGSGTMLVAPVRVGRGSYVGAGSTVTADVPPDSLALGRAVQVNKEGWVAQRKKTPAQPAAAPAPAGRTQPPITLPAELPINATLTRRDVGPVTVLELGGRLTMGRPVEDLGRQVCETLDEGRLRILLDLKGLVYIDSSGMGGFMAAANAVRAAGGELRISTVPSKVLRLMEVANLNQLFGIFESEEAAIKGFGAPPSA
jgi:bifunctional UDP-N-acetylglucosamine pyrophosphorylase / glucosamine-1-phosphate N-acetyltransferase